MKRRTTALAVAATLVLTVAPPNASGHYSHGWYWGAGLAERKLYNRYEDVTSADCEGFGYSIRARGGGRLYKHFDCFADTTDGDTVEAIVHVLGFNRFKVTFP